MTATGDRFPPVIVVITPAWVTGEPSATLMVRDTPHGGPTCDVCDRNGGCYIEQGERASGIPWAGFVAHIECIGASEGMGVYIIAGAESTDDPVVLAVLAHLYEPRHAIAS